MSKNKKTLIILDCNALIHRSFHALPDFRTAKGELVNAVYGFTSILLKVLREFEPDYVAAAFDVVGPTFRDEEYEEYKAKRAKAPDELYAQIPRVKEVLKAFNISVYEKEGFEADDVIGTIAKLAPKKQVRPEIETIIVSGDLDTLQLVDKYTKVYTMRKGLQDTVLYDEKAVKKRFGGLSPEQMADYKGLRGDPSDNIPGITGIGEKTAVQLLTDFGNMEKMYEALEKYSRPPASLSLGEAGEGARLAPTAVGAAKKFTKYSERIRNLIRDYKDQAFFSRELATIRKDVPIEFNMKDLSWRDYDKSEVERLFKEFEFRTLLNRLPENKSQNNAELNAEGRGNGKVQSDSVLDPVRFSDDPTFEKIENLYEEGVFSKEIYELEKKLAPVIRSMEKIGIKIDKKHFSKLEKEITKDLAESEEHIYKIARKKFNINSPQQLSEILFVQLQLQTKGLKKTPGGVVSTAAPELEKLQGEHLIIDHLLKYRELQKLYSTYIRPLPEIADSKDRIHTEFDQLGTATGRLSSSNPNMQNIPIKGEWGTKIRKGFIAEKGHKLVAFDYSQMELRIAAHIADDRKMKEFFEEGRDIHTMTASEVFGIKPEDITKDMRNRAKALNFGVLYGMGASGFAKSANISRGDAQTFIDDYFVRFPAIREYIENTKASARERGYVETLLGRKRYVPEINSSFPPLRAQAERMAINHPIQGTAADIIKMAMVEVSLQLTANSLPQAESGRQQSAVSCQLLLQIHDELLFEIQSGKMKELYPSIKNIMEGAYKLSVSLKVEVYYGPSWGELKN